ncbi:hypothetical protein SDC9_50736 [bioreactor metagenome]|uniref:Uncharacterized protein n=1 Tax=bioreactor metagenome TaxID=1076179 RepID=A0A644WLG6_9ZZZZ
MSGHGRHGEGVLGDGRPVDAVLNDRGLRAGQRHAAAVSGVRHEEDDSRPGRFGPGGVDRLYPHHILAQRITGAGLRGTAFPDVGDRVAVRVGAGGRDGDGRTGRHAVAVRRAGDDRRGGRGVYHREGDVRPVGGKPPGIPGADLHGMRSNGIAAVGGVAGVFQRHGIAVRVGGRRVNVHQKISVLCGSGDGGATCGLVRRGVGNGEALRIPENPALAVGGAGSQNIASGGADGDDPAAVGEASGIAGRAAVFGQLPCEGSVFKTGGRRQGHGKAGADVNRGRNGKWEAGDGLDGPGVGIEGKFPAVPVRDHRPQLHGNGLVRADPQGAAAAVQRTRGVLRIGLCFAAVFRHKPIHGIAIQLGAGGGDRDGVAAVGQCRDADAQGRNGVHGEALAVYKGTARGVRQSQDQLIPAFRREGDRAALFGQGSGGIDRIRFRTAVALNNRPVGGETLQICAADADRSGFSGVPGLRRVQRDGRNGIDDGRGAVGEHPSQSVCHGGGQSIVSNVLEQDFAAVGVQAALQRVGEIHLLAVFGERPFHRKHIVVAAGAQVDGPVGMGRCRKLEGNIQHRQDFDLPAVFIQEHAARFIRDPGNKLIGAGVLESDGAAAVVQRPVDVGKPVLKAEAVFEEPFHLQASKLTGFRRYGDGGVSVGGFRQLVGDVGDGIDLDGRGIAVGSARGISEGCFQHIFALFLKADSAVGIRELALHIIGKDRSLAVFGQRPLDFGGPDVLEGRFHLNVGICVRDLRQVEAHGADWVDSDGLRGFKGSAGFIGQCSGESVYALVLEADTTARVGKGAIQLVGQRRGLAVLF